MFKDAESVNLIAQDRKVVVTTRGSPGAGEKDQRRIIRDEGDEETLRRQRERSAAARSNYRRRTCAATKNFSRYTDRACGRARPRSRRKAYNTPDSTR